MVDTHSDGVEGKTVWRYDPHIDPADRWGHYSSLQNYLNPLYGINIKYGSNFQPFIDKRNVKDRSD